jgi:DNA helicase-2/ATP-dependent DNA helicase PcrA
VPAALEPTALQQLLQAAHHDAELLDFLSDQTLELQHLAATEGSVELMTVHQAKGLEAEVVHVVGMEQFGSFCRNDEDKYEEIRVLFVALTRTEQHLYLSWTNRPQLLPVA